METVNRGGNRVKMVKTVSFHVAVIPIGELDEYGKDLLDAMLEGGRDHINDIVDNLESDIFIYADDCSLLASGSDWSTQINDICLKANRKLAVLRKVKLLKTKNT